MPATSDAPLAPVRSRVERLKAARERVRARRGGRIALKVAAAVIGGGVIAVGIVLLPLPGPGWLIIFAGLGILASEYEWAARLLKWGRDQLSRWTHWVKRQSRPVQALVGLAGLVFLAAVAFAAWWVYVR
jgi:uncharacterized protein (TIGR02611 family)